MGQQTTPLPLIWVGRLPHCLFSVDEHLFYCVNLPVPLCLFMARSHYTVELKWSSYCVAQKD